MLGCKALGEELQTDCVGWSDQHAHVGGCIRLCTVTGKVFCRTTFETSQWLTISTPWVGSFPLTLTTWPLVPCELRKRLAEGMQRNCCQTSWTFGQWTDGETYGSDFYGTVWAACWKTYESPLCNHVCLIQFIPQFRIIFTEVTIQHAGLIVGFTIVGVTAWGKLIIHVKHSASWTLLFIIGYGNCCKTGLAYPTWHWHVWSDWVLGCCLGGCCMLWTPDGWAPVVCTIVRFKTSSRGSDAADQRLGSSDVNQHHQWPLVDAEADIVLQPCAPLFAVDQGAGQIAGPSLEVDHPTASELAPIAVASGEGHSAAGMPMKGLPLQILHVQQLGVVELRILQGYHRWIHWEVWRIPSFQP